MPKRNSCGGCSFALFLHPTASEVKDGFPDFYVYCLHETSLIKGPRGETLALLASSARRNAGRLCGPQALWWKAAEQLLPEHFAAPLARSKRRHDNASGGASATGVRVKPGAGSMQVKSRSPRRGEVPGVPLEEYRHKRALYNVPGEPDHGG